MQSIRNSIFKRISGGGRGRSYTSKDFFDLGSRAAVDQSLSRLARTGLMRRIKSGIYDFPRINPRLGGVLTPNMDDVVKSIARKNNIRIMASEAVAANRLGLSTQVPAQMIFLTDGPSKKIQINNFNIKFSHASPKRMSICGTKSEMILQALYYFGKSRVDDTMIKRISNMLSKEDKEHLIQDARFSPAWIILVVNKIKGDK